MHKKGLSAVIASVLLVLGVIVFSGVIWFVIQGLISSSQKDISSGVNLLNLKISNVYVEAGKLVVDVSRKVGRGSLNSINFVLETGTDNEIIKQETNLKELGNYKFVLSLTKVNPDEIKKVSIAPDSGEVVDVWETEERGLNCAPACTGKICGDDGCGGLCNNGAKSISCTATFGTCTNPLGTKTCLADGTDYGDCVATDPRLATCNGKQCGSDGCGGVCAPGCTSTQDCSASGLCLNKLRIFVTTGSYTGNLGGVSGADNKCKTDSNKPAGTETWKALIGSATRYSGANDWVLQANRNYYQVDGNTIIGSSYGNNPNSGCLDYNTLQNKISPTTINVNVWTGLNPVCGATTGDNCGDWISSTSGGGYSGGSTYMGYLYIYNNVGACSNTDGHLYCVEQP